jgi:hypothetical protein
VRCTELAASALGARVHRYVDELLAGRLPEPLHPAFPDGLTDAQRVVATTIHAFCQTIICSYAARPSHRRV